MLSSRESMWQYVQKLFHLPAQWEETGNQIPCAFTIFSPFFSILLERRHMDQWAPTSDFNRVQSKKYYLNKKNSTV